MELKWGHYCMHMLLNGVGVDVIHKIDTFGADPGQPVPSFPFPVSLGVRVHASARTHPEGHVLQAVIKDATDQALSSMQSVPLEFFVPPPEYPLLGLGLVPLNAWRLPTIGRYRIDLAVDNAPIGYVPLIVHRRQGKVPPVESGDAPPVRLIWAHYLLRFGEHPKLPGGMNLGGIFELLPRSLGYNLKGTLLLLHIESDLTVRTQRQLKAELVDSNDQAARTPDGRLIMPPIVRPITLRRQTPAWDFLVSTATLRFDWDVSLPPGAYRFRFYVDGQPLGEPLDVTVMDSG
jgi:hypothetical protein